ncbi:MAG: hypothetical protein AMJ79_00085 [Phycisphaerae bacterium SM23_30]|nr:MAG: hypothetical protein AMJ79_00085 [Phycisphaerae bacterium SM23_30]
MVAVNLTPDEFKTAQKRRQRLRFWVLMLLAVAITAGGWATMIYFDYRRANQTLHRITREYQDLQHTIKALGQVRNRLDLWQDRIALLNELNHYHDFVRVTDYLTQHSPDLIYLEQMKFWRPDKPQSTDQPKTQSKAAHMFILKHGAEGEAVAATDTNIEPIMISLKGRSVNYQAVADYLQMLSSADIIAGAQLKYSRRQSALSSETGEIVDFEIEARLLPMLSP